MKINDVGFARNAKIKAYLDSLPDDEVFQAREIEKKLKLSTQALNNGVNNFEGYHVSDGTRHWWGSRRAIQNAIEEIKRNED